MHCPNCDAPARVGARYCTRCGATLPIPPSPPEATRHSPDRVPIAIGLGILTLILLSCNGLALVATVPDPVGMLLSLAAAFIPAAIYTAIILSTDRYEREPWSTVLGAFGWGALVATLFAGIFNSLSAALLGQLFASTIGAPLVEETLKGVALLGLLVMFRSEFDNMLDGLIYGALIGMGFELTEDVLYLGGAYMERGLAGLGEEWLLRPVLTGAAHALFTGTTGAAVGWARGRHGVGVLRFVVPVLGWALAVFQHFLWNTGGVVLAASLGRNFPSPARLGLQTLALLVPAILLLYIVSRVARAREARIIHEQLAGEVTGGVITAGEHALLSDNAARRRALAEAERRGSAMRGAQRQFFQAAAELAFRKHHAAHGERLTSNQRHTSEDAYRAQIAAARATLATPDPGGPPPNRE